MTDEEQAFADRASFPCTVKIDRGDVEPRVMMAIEYTKDGQIRRQGVSVPREKFDGDVAFGQLMNWARES